MKILCETAVQVECSQAHTFGQHVHVHVQRVWSPVHNMHWPSKALSMSHWRTTLCVCWMPVHSRNAILSTFWRDFSSESHINGSDRQVTSFCLPVYPSVITSTKHNLWDWFAFGLAFLESISRISRKVINFLKILGGVELFNAILLGCMGTVMVNGTGNFKPP